MTTSLTFRSYFLCLCERWNSFEQVKPRNQSLDRRWKKYLSQCVSSPGAQVESGCRLVLGAGPERLSGYNYLVSSANYTPSITTALYHGPLLTHSYTSHHPTHPPSAAPRGLDKNARLPPEPDQTQKWWPVTTLTHTAPPPHNDK